MTEQASHRAELDSFDRLQICQLSLQQIAQYTCFLAAAGPIKASTSEPSTRQDDDDNVEKKGKMTELDQHNHRYCT